MKYRGLVIGLAVLLALALQVGELSAFDSPPPTPEATPAPPPPRPKPPYWESKAKPKHEASRVELGEVDFVQPTGLHIDWLAVSYQVGPNGD